jgi:hypothetical protein
MHVKRTGQFKIRITCEGVPSSFAFFLRLLLVRDHYGFSHIPVDQVCKKHQGQGDDELKNHVLRFPEDYKDYRANYVEGCRPSVVFEVPPPEDGKIEVTLPVYFICNDSCVTSQQMVSESKSMTHKARDLRLVCTLEIRRNFGDALEIVQRNSMLLWIKAALYKTDLIREQRRGPQGGLAQKLKRESNEPEPGTSTTIKRRKTGDKKVKVPASMKVAPCDQLAPPVDHLEALLSERVWPAENQVTALESLYEEMLRTTVARNEAVFKNLQ